MMTAQEVKQFAKATLTNESSTAEEQTAARSAISRINAQLKIAKGKPKRPRKNDYESTEAYNQALSEFRSVLDRLAIEKECGRILDSHDSSPLQRHNARRKLGAFNPPLPDVQPDPDQKASSDAPRREDFGWSGRGGEDWDEFLTSGGEEKFQAAVAKWRQTAPPPSDPKVAAFLNALDDSCFDLPARPVPQSIKPQTPIAPPIDPALFCEHCAVLLRVCGCDRVICNLCLRPQSECFAPCRQARPHTGRFCFNQ